LGGLPKKTTILKKMNFDPNQTLLIDSGALLFARHQAGAAIKAGQDQILAEAIVSAYNEMGYEAVGISSYDLAGGLSFLSKMAELSTFPWLSANLVDQESKKPIFSPSLILGKSGLKIGIIGLTDQRGLIHSKKDNYHVLPWQKILPTELNKLSSQCDIIVLFSSLSTADNKKISQLYPRINIILQAGINTNNLKAHLINNTLTTQTAKQGKYLGRIQINWHSNGKWQSSRPDPLSDKKKELDRLNWQINKFRSKGNPAEIYKNKPKVLQGLIKMEERKLSLSEEISKLTSQTKNGVNKSNWQGDFIAVEIDIDDDPAVDMLVQQAKRQVNEMGQRISRKKGLVGYSGHIRCQECHEEEYRGWTASRHASAFATLTKRKQQYNVNCLPCHVTGINADNRNLALALPLELQSVGCEACHGPGLQHADNPRSNPLTTPVITETCLKCHNDEHDDSFDFTRDSKLAH